MKVFVLALLTGFTLRAQHDVTPAVRDRIERPYSRSTPR